MSYGMSYDEYWHGDTVKLKFYRNKQKILNRKRNEELWLEGLYFKLAIESEFSKEYKYPDEPLPLTRKEQKEQDRRKAIAKFDAIAKHFNEQLRRTKGGGENNG